MITGAIQPTSEQQDIVSACADGYDLGIEAGAGTGKTSTLQLAASAMTGRRGLYLAYTRATAASARAQFPGRIECVTAHSLAYRAIGWQYASRLSGRASRMPAWAVARQLGIGRPLPLGDRLLLTPAHQARIVLGTVERFCYSGDQAIGGAHVPPVNGVDSASFAELTWRIIPWAERAWHDIRRAGGTLPFRHDHYLKLWQLTHPVIGGDFIMFDEAQDANPVTASVVQSQSMQKIAVGDSCQAIYGWRGAVDALATWPADLRLQLSCSFRFGQAVAEEANKWLEALDAPFLLSGAPRIVSAVGPLAEPHAIICRTNAEALLQAQAALNAGRRVALAGGGQEIGQLALAALELQATGRTSSPELSAFRSWDAVQLFVRTDTAGADLAASVRLIDKHGPDAVLATVEQLSDPRRADLVVSTAHRAKGLEWGSVQVAGDFRRAGAAGPPARAEAMLAYVAVTRARTGLDQTGLAWIDEHVGRSPATTLTKEIRMDKKEFDIGFGTNDADQALVDDDPRVPAEPYAGGRAQAEAGSEIVEKDYFGWLATALETPGLPPSHPRTVQLGNAWRAVSKTGLGDDPGAASIRYRILAHAAGALLDPVSRQGLTGEAGALQTLSRHAFSHGRRLHATSLDLFTRSGKSGPYTGRGHAADGSRIVACDYRQWTRLPAAALAAAEPALREPVASLRKAWADIERHGLADGPGPSAVRYHAVAGYAANLAENFTCQLPSTALIPLLELAAHADKHAIRLHSTAIARNGDTAIGYEALCQATWGRAVTATATGQPAPYLGLPASVATATARGHSEIPHGGRAAAPAASSPARPATRRRAAQTERA
jgi:UvrD/REP helicase N-terminal domain